MNDIQRARIAVKVLHADGETLQLCHAIIIAQYFEISRSVQFSINYQKTIYTFKSVGYILSALVNQRQNRKKGESHEQFEKVAANIHGIVENVLCVAELDGDKIIGSAEN